MQKANLNNIKKRILETCLYKPSTLIVNHGGLGSFGNVFGTIEDVTFSYTRYNHIYKEDKFKEENYKYKIIWYKSIHTKEISRVDRLDSNRFNSVEELIKKRIRKELHYISKNG